MTKESLQFNNLEQKVFWFLIVAILISGLTYIYFINSSILYAAARQKNINQIENMETEISISVSEYMAFSHNINLAEALRLGLKDISGQDAFVVRGEPAITLTFRDNEI